MDQQQQHEAQGRGRSPSAAGHRQPHISHSPSPAGGFIPNDPAASTSTTSTSTAAIGLGLGLEASSQSFIVSQPDYSAYNNPNGFLGQDLSFDPNQPFTDQLKSDNSEFNQSFLTPPPSFGQDFTIFPTSAAEQLSTPLFIGDDGQQQQQQQFGTPDMNAMATSQTHHSPTPPHLLKPDPHQSPSFNAHQFSSPAGRHSRNASLGPQDALLPGQVDWSGTQFQTHRRTPSEFSDASSVGHSPALMSQDQFPDQLEHSPMQRPQDVGVYQELHGIGSFTISDQPGRSPSHSPAISPRILPQSLPDMGQGNNFMLQAQNNGYGQPYMQGPGQVSEAFPQLATSAADMSQMGQMSAPTINIEMAPTAPKSGFDNRSVMDTDALTPPEGRGRSRRRAHTDPYSPGGAAGSRSPSNGSLSPHLGADLSPRPDASRSLSPLDRSGTSPNRRRQSTSAVPPNVIALRLADPEGFAAAGSGEAGGGPGGPKRVQKHPATFQCSLCPKRFTRAYNLRSHLRTHTDERPFVCTVCGKAFARQHDRKRHEGLHSGEKKFVCKGELKAGGQWGCGRRFARADALGRHFRSEAGRICIKPLLDEEMLERQRAWQEQHMQAAQAQQSMMMPPIDPNTGYPLDAAGNYALPAALLAQYPALAQVNWSAPDMGAGSGMEDDLSGRSSFEASDYEEGEDTGYVSGPGTGFGDGSMQQSYVPDMGYASDYGSR